MQPPAIICSNMRYTHERALIEQAILCSMNDGAKVSLYIVFFSFTGVKLIYNVVLVSAVQRSESAICIPISPPSWTSLPPSPIPPI